MVSPQVTHNPCPCGSGRDYDRCCGPLIEHDVQAVTAEQLMRSRYTAFVLGRENYLLRTWHESTRPASLGLESETRPKWLGLKILACEAGGPDDDEGRVEFIARYRLGGAPAVRLRENSRFLREQGRWCYVDGEDGSGDG